MPQQLGFFHTGASAPPRTIADDDTGTIVYTPAVFTLEESDSFFCALRDGIAWQADRRMMYDREIQVPRLVAHFEIGRLPRALEPVRDRIEAIVRLRFDRAGLNLYRDGRDSVAWHNDDLTVLGETPTIALVSLGATRRMHLRTKAVAPLRRSLRIELEPGSLLVMSGASQQFWEHAVLKDSHPVGPRISIALRRCAR